MLAMIKQLVLDFSDLRYLEIACPACKATLTLDAKSENSSVPASCFGCGKPYDEISVRHPVRTFVQIYSTLCDPKQAMEFKVRITAPQALGCFLLSVGLGL